MASCDKRPLSRWFEEPFRIFFPAAAFFGAVGVALWPLYVSGMLSYYPAISHSRLLIEGFAGGFVFGFLLTAGPRLLAVALPAPMVVISVAGLSWASAIFHLANRSSLGDLAFASATLVVVVWFIRAFARRRDLPPPGFVLAAAGIACGLVGSALLGLFGFVVDGASAYQAGKILLFQGFTALPMLGVGAFFFPKIVGGVNRHEFPESRYPSREWKRRAVVALGAVMVFGISVALELDGWHAAAYGMRTALVIGYLVSEIPLRNKDWWKAPQGRALGAVLVAMALAFAGSMAMPELAIAWMHAFFIAGLSGAVFIVSARVVFGHAGRPDLARRSATPLAIGVALLGLAGATRLWADVMPRLQASHYVYAAVLWLACAGVWLVWVAPKTWSRKGHEGIAE